MCLRRLTLAGRLAGAVVVALQWVTATQWSLPAAPVARVLLGSVALVIAGFHLFNTQARRTIGHWEREDLVPLLRGELLLGCGLPMVVVLIAALMPLSMPMLIVIGLIFLVGGNLYEPLEEEIHELIEADPTLAQGTRYFAGCRPLKFMKIDRTIEDMSKAVLGPGLQKFLAFWVKPTWRPCLSRTRIVLIYSMLACFVVAAGAAGDVSIQEYGAGHSPPANSSPIDNTGGDRDNREGGDDDASGDASGSGETSDSKRPCPHLPAFGAPAWARSDLNALYLGGKHLHSTPPPGGAGGCTDRAIVPASEHGTFVYTIGRNALGEILSVAVDSLEFGPAIFLSPASKRVLALIHTGDAPLGGYPTRNVAGGDYAAAVTEHGTFVFVRGAKHLPDKTNVAMPYVSFPPTVATAWLGAMKELESWLWPLPPSRGESIERFRFVVKRGNRKAAAAVSLSLGDGSATRSGYAYELPEPQLSKRELKRLAELAR